MEQQAEQGTNMEVGESYEYDDLIEGLKNSIKPLWMPSPILPPMLPHTFLIIGTGPRLYTHDEDEAAARAYDAMPRKLV